MDKLKLPTIIISIGLVLAIIACLLVGIVKVPTVTEHEFNYSVTYKLDGEIKTFEGVYTCKFDDSGDPLESVDRYYYGEYADYGLAQHTASYTIAQKNGMDLAIVTSFNDSYLMGDTNNEYYDGYVDDPYLIVYDQQEVAYEDSETIGMFNAEIISWEYPEPIENSFSFLGFSMLHEVSLFALLGVGILVVLACMIFVRKDEDVVYGALDTVGIALNVIFSVTVYPFITLVSWLVQAFQTGPDWIYQIDLCIPAIIAFSFAASISLRRRGFAKSGFFIQFIGPVLFILLAVLERVL